MTPQETLLQNEALINLVTEHAYIPHKDHGSFHQIVSALKIIDPKAQYRTDCSGCIMEIVRMAGIHLKAYKASLANGPAPVFHTFPKRRPRK